MKCVLFLLFAVLFVAVQSEPEPEPTVHRVTGHYVTHIHTFRHKIPAGKGGKGGKGKPKGKGDGGGQNGKCENTGLTGTANKLDNGLQKATGKIASTLGANKKHPGLLGNLAGGAKTLANDVFSGLDQGVSDFFCGFNRVFNKIGSKAGKGKLLQGIVSGANTFITGAGSFFGNLGTNALGAITNGFSRATGHKH